ATLRATATSGLYSQDVEDAFPVATPAPAPAAAEAALPAAASPVETPDVPAATLREAYEEFRRALAAAGVDADDRETAGGLMRQEVGRASSKAEPYTAEESRQAARQLRRERLAA